MSESKKFFDYRVALLDRVVKRDDYNIVEVNSLAYKFTISLRDVPCPACKRQHQSNRMDVVVRHKSCGTSCYQDTNRRMILELGHLETRVYAGAKQRFVLYLDSFERRAEDMTPKKAGCLECSGPLISAVSAAISGSISRDPRDWFSGTPLECHSAEGVVDFLVCESEACGLYMVLGYMVTLGETEIYIQTCSFSTRTLKEQRSVLESGLDKWTNLPKVLQELTSSYAISDGRFSTGRKPRGSSDRKATATCREIVGEFGPCGRPSCCYFCQDDNPGPDSVSCGGFSTARDGVKGDIYRVVEALRCKQDGTTTCLVYRLCSRTGEFSFRTCRVHG